MKGCVATIETLAFTWDKLGYHWRLFFAGGGGDAIGGF